MRRHLFIMAALLLFASATVTAAAQGLLSGVNFYINYLNSTGAGAGSRARVSLDVATATAVNAYAKPEKVAAYRVCVFSDNSQSARGAAASALGAIGTVANGVKGDMVYDNPFFRVYAGYCLTKTEATILLGRLKGSFPKAFIVPWAMNVADLGTPIFAQPEQPELPTSDEIVPLQ